MKGFADIAQAASAERTEVSDLQGAWQLLKLAKLGVRRRLKASQLTTSLGIPRSFKPKLRCNSPELGASFIILHKAFGYWEERHDQFEEP